MPCEHNCGGHHDLFVGFIHAAGCPSRQTGSNRLAAEERMKHGCEDAFGRRPMDLAFDPSYELGKKREEKRRVKDVVNNVFGFPIGGRRHR